MAHNVGPTQVPLLGLYGLLGVKDGSNPDTITGFVQPTIATEGYWLRATRTQAAPGGGGACGVGVDLVSMPVDPPNNETWYLHNLVVEVWGPTITWAELFVWAGSLLVGRLYTTGAVAAVPGSADKFVTLSLRDLWLPPGAHVNLVTDGTAADTYRFGGPIVSKARV